MQYCPMRLLYYRFSPGTGNVPVPGTSQVTGTSPVASTFPPPVSGMPAAGIKKSAEDIRCLAHLLWEQHVYWTRLLIISVAFGLPDLDTTTKRLLRNPEDFRLHCGRFTARAQTVPQTCLRSIF